jgi:hypothetical protein
MKLETVLLKVMWSRNSAINKFKTGKNNEGNDNKVIMLSLKNAASGTNLTEATHIFFVEPINTIKEESNAIESQAIARACRVGQKKKIMLMRVLIEKTIEEKIYRKNYNNNVVVSFEEQNYMIELSKIDDIENNKNDIENNKNDIENNKNDIENDKTKVIKKSKKIIKNKTHVEIDV